MKECLYRACRTFIQTAIGYIAVNIAIVDFTSSKQTLKSALVGLLIASISAGVSAVMNIKKDEEQK